MRTALLIGLMVVSVAGSAQAQGGYLGGYKPYQPPKPYSSDRDPYDLPKAQQTNPYDRDYSKNPNDSARYKNTYENQRDDGYSNGYGANRRPAAAPSYGSTRSSSGSRSNPACSRPGVVC